MIFPSHLLATLLACAVVAHFRPLSRQEWLLALAFGVVIDVDHLLQMPAYIATHGWSAMTPAQIAGWGGAWQGFMHRPTALLVVVPAMVLFRSWAPLGAWGLHMVQDFVIATRFVRFGSPLEWAIDALLFAALVGILVFDHRRHGGRVGLAQHALARAAFVLPRR